ncbi:MAG: CRISPR-associated endonuclease Cas2 [Candidatus Krumholzibacteriia bacterium]
MRTIYIVTYDISSPRRLRRVFNTLRGYGDHLQLSVFRCELSARELALLNSDLLEVISSKEDQVLFFPLGPASGHNHENVKALGRAYVALERHAKVI